jgi:aconitate hydratase
MVRGTFANTRLRNGLAQGKEGSFTRHLPTGELTTVFDASVKYQAEGVPLMVLAGKEYGSGSSRDWAAKGTFMLGIKAVIAQSYERIHRSNLIGMGVLPLQFADGESKESLGLTGEETYDIGGIAQDLAPGKPVAVHVTAPDGTSRTIAVKARIDTIVELEYYKHGGILQYVLRQLMKG